MGTTGGDRDKLMEDVLKSGVYSVIAPQMGKQVMCLMTHFLSINPLDTYSQPVDHHFLQLEILCICASMKWSVEVLTAMNLKINCVPGCSISSSYGDHG